MFWILFSTQNHRDAQKNYFTIYFFILISFYPYFLFFSVPFMSSCVRINAICNKRGNMATVA